MLDCDRNNKASMREGDSYSLSGLFDALSVVFPILSQ